MDQGFPHTMMDKRQTSVPEHRIINIFTSKLWSLSIKYSVKYHFASSIKKSSLKIIHCQYLPYKWLGKFLHWHTNVILTRIFVQTIWESMCILTLEARGEGESTQLIKTVSCTFWAILVVKKSVNNSCYSYIAYIHRILMSSDQLLCSY
jgi:hypothetical protein